MIAYIWIVIYCPYVFKLLSIWRRVSTFTLRPLYFQMYNFRYRPTYDGLASS
jgi:hypothetical protein